MNAGDDLANKLFSISKIDETKSKLIPYEYDESHGIDDFWDKYIKKYLFDSKVLEDWFNMLNDYIYKCKDPVFAIRSTYSNRQGEKKMTQTQKDQSLRRGFYNTTANGFSFFYTDNYYAHYMAKMAADGYCPSLSDFEYMMKNREFPARFGQSCDAERQNALYNIVGQVNHNGIRKTSNPHLTDNYYVAHIYEAADYFYLTKKNTNKKSYYSGTEILNTFGGRGEYSDWNVKNNKTRDLGDLEKDNPFKESVKEIFGKMFLRFACPINYIIIPNKDSQRLNHKENKNIGEMPEFIGYAKNKLRTIYPKVFTDFANSVYVGEEEQSRLLFGKQILNMQEYIQNQKFRHRQKSRSKIKPEIHQLNQELPHRKVFHQMLLPPFIHTYLKDLV